MKTIRDSNLTPITSTAPAASSSPEAPPGQSSSQSPHTPASLARSAYFRLLRAAELAAWDATGGDALRANCRRSARLLSCEFSPRRRVPDF